MEKLPLGYSIFQKTWPGLYQGQNQNKSLDHSQGLSQEPRRESQGRKESSTRSRKETSWTMTTLLSIGTRKILSKKFNKPDMLVKLLRKIRKNREREI